MDTNYFINPFFMDTHNFFSDICFTEVSAWSIWLWIPQHLAHMLICLYDVMKGKTAYNKHITVQYLRNRISSNTVTQPLPPKGDPYSTRVIHTQYLKTKEEAECPCCHKTVWVSGFPLRYSSGTGVVYLRMSFVKVSCCDRSCYFRHWTLGKYFLHLTIIILKHWIVIHNIEKLSINIKPVWCKGGFEYWKYCTTYQSGMTRTWLVWLWLKCVWYNNEA